MSKVNTKDLTGRTITLTNVRLSFGDSLDVASLPKKNKDPNAKPKHGVNLIIEKSHPEFAETQKIIIGALKAAAREFKKPEEWWKQLYEDKPDNICLKKGERFKTDAGEIYKGYDGNLVLALKGPAGGAKRPQIRDRNKKIVHAPGLVDDTSKITTVAYNGSYADAIVSFYGTENGGTARLTGSVEAIRSHERGEKLGGGGVYVEDDDFDDLENDDSFDNGPDTTGAGAAAEDDDIL